MKNTALTYDSTKLVWFENGEFKKHPLQAGEEVNQIFADYNMIVTKVGDNYNVFILGEKVEKLGELPSTCSLYAIGERQIACSTFVDKKYYELTVYSSLTGTFNETNRSLHPFHYEINETNRNLPRNEPEPSSFLLRHQ